ncbi:nuclear pore complex protein Nup205-like [Watersipora subatra]|uniref:nuclear pore complex protein Nup205-like n=1 Tax=Watersipora subatra TaxID=2589382 RepID=UPI00355B29D2
MAANSKTRVSVNSEQCKLWTSYKELDSVVTDAVVAGNTAAQGDLELILRKHRTSFISLLETAPKNASHRKIIEKAGTDGVLIISSSHSGTCSLDEATITETLILSDLFNINELEALELLLAGESQMAQYPNLPRGLIAVLLYQDGRRCLTTSLRSLVQARQGRLCSSSISHDMQDLITSYTDQLIGDGILNKILAQLLSFDIDDQMRKMSEQRAIGKAKHHHQVLSLLEETKQSIADTVFYWSCHRQFSKAETQSLLKWLREAKLTDGRLDGSSLAVLMAFIYAIDVDDEEDEAAKLPMFSDNTFISSIHDMIKAEGARLRDRALAAPKDTTAQEKLGLHAVIQFAWSLTLRVAAQHPLIPSEAAQCCEEDDDLIESAFLGQVFKFLTDSVLSSPGFTGEDEFYMRKMHDMITTFLVQMPFKVKELRDIGDDSARILLHHQQNGREPPSNLRKDFEQLLHLIGEFYSMEQNRYDLSEEYWCVARPPPPKQISLHKFLRLAGELVPPPLFVTYLGMLTGLSSSCSGAINCYNILKANGDQASLVSWDHVFASLNQYFTTLRQDVSSKELEGAHLSSRAPIIRDITEQELSGLIAVCKLITMVAEKSTEVRCALMESQLWLPSVVLFGLVGCSVPISLKAEILLALASLAKSPECASPLWQALEVSQLLVTTTSHGFSAKPAGGLVTELENVESRLETYPMVRAFLQLLSNLCESSGNPPESLGAGYRAPGFQPYLIFIINDVLLKFNSRGYKKSSEKWQVAAGALSILHKLLQAHEVEPENFVDHLVELPSGKVVSEQKAAGHTILTLFLKDSPLLKTVLTVISIGLQQLLLYDSSLPGRKAIEESTLLALQLLNLTLDKQEIFLDLLRQSGHSTIVSRLEKLLLGINPLTKQADHLITISRYTSLVNLLPNHALHAVCIMGSVCKQPTIQAELLSLYLADLEVSREIVCGLVEGIEQANDGPQFDETGYSQTRCETASATLRLLQDTLSQPSPNIVHFLLGFNVNKPLSQTDLQAPGGSGPYRTCLHAAVSLVDSDLAPPPVVELAYQLIYMLCSNAATSAPVMRYLRTAQDFFYKTLCKVPFAVNAEAQDEASHILKQQTWFMKSLAIELRVTSLNQQRSHTQRLISCLLDSGNSVFSRSIGGGVGVDLSSTLSTTVPNISTLAQLNYQQGTSQRKSRLLQFLDHILFHDTSIGEITLEHFNTGSIMQVLTSCEEQLSDSSLVAINISQVHRLLIQEINIAQQGANTGPPAHREALMMEVREILSYAVAWNAVREDVHARLQAFDSWRQVAEMILCGCPEQAMLESRRSVILDLLNAVINKCLQEGGLDDLISPACGVILTLMSNLRQTMFKESFEESALSSSILVVLKGVLNLIVSSSGSLQRARANLYGALLYYLQICEQEIPKSIDPILEGGVGSALMGKESTNEKLAKESLSTIYGFGDALLTVICRDACDGLNVSRMLALSCLDSISALDPSSIQVLKFMSVHGYIRHLVESLVQSDAVLIRSLDPSEPLRHLYIYESTMSLLTRLAMTAQGASALLSNGLTLRLAECTVYDAKPNTSNHRFPRTTDSMDHEGFSPSTSSRYRQVLLPCLRLCQTVLVSLGSENETAASQVMKFIVAHGDAFYNILRDDAAESCESLEELSLLTAVLSRAAAYTSVSDSAEEREVMFKGQVSRIQRRLGGLLSKYLLLDEWNKKLRSHESCPEAQAQMMLVYVHEIAANLTRYCRNVIANSTHDSSLCRVLFGPSLSAALDSGDAYAKSASAYEYSQSATSPPPNLGLIVIQIRQASAEMLEALDEHKQLNSRLDCLPPISSSPDQEDSNQMSESRKTVLEWLERQTHIIHLLSLVIESCLYIVWSHLDFYLISCVPEDQNTSLFRTHQANVSMRRLTDSTMPTASSSGDKSEPLASTGITKDQLNLLRETTPRALNEPLLQKLSDIEQCYASKRTHYGYIGALTRRLRRLIDIHCS